MLGHPLVDATGALGGFLLLAEDEATVVGAIDVLQGAAEEGFGFTGTGNPRVEDFFVGSEEESEMLGAVEERARDKLVELGPDDAVLDLVALVNGGEDRRREEGDVLGVGVGSEGVLVVGVARLRGADAATNDPVENGFR
jgi:hypothetical protein